MKLIPQLEPGHRVLFASMLGSFALFGLNMTAIGAVLPTVIVEFQWSYTTTGVVLYASALGYFVATFLSGVLIHRLGPRKVIVGGLLIQAVGLGLFGLTGSIAVNVVLRLLSGAGAAGTEVVVNFGVVRMERGGQSRLMNLMHAAFAAGSVVSPLVVLLIAEAGASWQTIFRLGAVLSLAMAAAMAAMPLSRLDVAVEAGHEPARLGEVLRNPLVILGSLILMVYVGVEIGVTDWVAKYCVEITPAYKKYAGLLVSAFWLGLLAGRIGVSALYHGERQDRLLLGMGVTATAAMVALAFTPSFVGVAAAVFVAGLGFSAIYPVVMALLGRHLHGGQSLAVAMASTGGGVGAFVFPFAMTAVFDRIGIARGFGLYAGLTGVMLVLVIAAVGVVKRMDAQG
jgi:fucose permease